MEIAAWTFFELHRTQKMARPPVTNICAKVTHSTNIAQKASVAQPLTLILAPFQCYSSIFSEKASERLPKHQPWDHAIDLKPGATLKNCGIYCLTLAENLALRAYITEHLKKGYIRPLKSPMASPFFFVGKKDGSKLQLVQDYQKLNDITIKNQTPLPLIPELLNKLQGARYFSKFDVRWGYNNIHIKENDE